MIFVPSLLVIYILLQLYINPVLNAFIHIHLDISDQQYFYLYHFHIIIIPIRLYTSQISIHSFIIELQYNHVLIL